MTNAAHEGGERGDSQQGHRSSSPRQTASHEISWYKVAAFVGPLIDRYGSSLPLPGSPEWCGLPDADPRKLGALLSVARFWAFDAACQQQALAEASKAVAASADWPAIAREIHQRQGMTYIRRRP
ncbi:DUF2742 domain-containing protein [Mycobacterium paraffinicum]|uniref:DUF2742 domain-containing protein n=1 Tax=Mycobacterium paraffinicum TaxID=53378 RepID=UPI0021F25538|nr:DUF2742 domain-containing protein [Mycobacterium paraffinicum]MCV7313729.1 DUF2742 domain-containing protein [Mycobacterium paraffinicum]